MKAIRNPETEPAWDTVGISSCDFRPHFDGDLVNVFTVVLPDDTETATEAQMVQRAITIARWLADHRKEFGKHDRFQIIIGWPESIRKTGRQVVKTCGTFDEAIDVAEGRKPIQFMPGWSKGIFQEMKTEPSRPA